MTPDEFLEIMKEGASNKVKETLDSIYNICTEQKERGINDFSIATIAKLGATRGVPKAQSIRNKSGEKYKAMITAFADSIPKKNKLKTLSLSESDWIDEIPNPKHQLLARIMASELKEAKQTIQEFVPPKQRIEIYDYRNTKPQDMGKFNAQEKRAIEYMLSDSFKNKWNLTENEYGEMLDEHGIPVFKVSTVDALKKALEYLS
jgi:hypothetical protein